jgi:DNA-3-methyladenine glycosylase II
VKEYTWVVNTDQKYRDLVQKAEDALQKMDPKLGTLIEFQKPIFFEPRRDYFFSLCRTIVGQQVSLPSAIAIFSRLEKATQLDPQKVASLTEDQMKAIGLSRQKVAYITDLAQHFIKNPKIYEHLEQLGDEEVIKELMAVKGIGKWTAQMFLIFSLTRLDVFAPDDVGLQRAIMQLYDWKELPSKDKLETIAEQWHPYRTVASWHLWHSLHNTPA